ncbi:MAG: hypothetical protein HXY36_06085 [Chloroflexi bacterium]|nr:hypothetical protein [Chloroflexota bacterium]
MDWEAKWQKLTPAQRLWLEVFGLQGLPDLDQRKVLSIVDSLPAREARVVRLKYGFEGTSSTLKEIGKKLIRADTGEIGVSKEIARLELKKALHRLKHPRRRKEWEEAKL